MEFTPFPKVPRYSRECVITEKLDGTNASIQIDLIGPVEHAHLYDRKDIVCDVIHDGYLYILRVGSRKRFITPGKSTDNFGFAGWVKENAQELVKLGEGTHFGEWWGRGIQRGYGLDEKRFSLFNTKRWWDVHTGNADRFSANQGYAPACCHVVPILYRGPFDAACGPNSIQDEDAMTIVEAVLRDLKSTGSIASRGFDNPEGIMIYHTAANQYFKKTFEGDQYGKERS